MLAFVQALWEREGEPVRTDAMQFNLSIFNSTMRFLRSNLGRRHWKLYAIIPAGSPFLLHSLPALLARKNLLAGYSEARKADI